MVFRRRAPKRTGDAARPAAQGLGTRRKRAGVCVLCAPEAGKAGTAEERARQTCSLCEETGAQAGSETVGSVKGAGMVSVECGGWFAA